MAAHLEFTVHMVWGKPSGLYLLKVSVLVQNSSHMQSVLGMEMSIVTTPLKHEAVFEAYILLSL